MKSIAAQWPDAQVQVDLGRSEKLEGRDRLVHRSIDSSNSRRPCQARNRESELKGFTMDVPIFVNSPPDFRPDNQTNDFNRTAGCDQRFCLWDVTSPSLPMQEKSC